MERIVLIGAEDIARAGRDMQEAAVSISRAVSDLSAELFRHRQWLDEWLMRLEVVVEKTTND